MPIHFSVSSLSTYFSTLHGGEGPYSRWGRRPEPEALKSGLPVVVQCGGTLAKACFPGWRTWRRPRIIDPPFLLGGVRESIGNALLLEAAPQALPPRYGVLFTWFWKPRRNASGASGAPPKRTGKHRQLLEVERSSRKHQRPHRRRKGAPIVLMMLPYVARARARAPRTGASSAQLGLFFCLVGVFDAPLKLHTHIHIHLHLHIHDSSPHY